METQQSLWTASWGWVTRADEIQKVKLLALCRSSPFLPQLPICSSVSSGCVTCADFFFFSLVDVFSLSSFFSLRVALIQSPQLNVIHHLATDFAILWVSVTCHSSLVCWPAQASEVFFFFFMTGNVKTNWNNLMCMGVWGSFTFRHLGSRQAASYMCSRFR